MEDESSGLCRCTVSINLILGFRPQVSISHNFCHSKLVSSLQFVVKCGFTTCGASHL
eukprot:SAG11_NODE_1162_length_5642_cov_12.906188_2_plen_57_part_00